MTDLSTSNDGFSATRWFVISIFLCITFISGFWQTHFVNAVSPIIVILAIFIAVWLHGIERYGIKNMIVFFIITWVVSNFFEALSIQTGFPFGNYYYDKLLGPRLFQVPLIIMLAYFGIGYTSWTLAQVLLGQQSNRLAGRNMVLVPLIASCVMVMWDLCMDPLCSTIASLWVWRDGGPYFGVPLQNYFGWFLVVYIIYQGFAFYIAKYDVIYSSKMTIYLSKIFWLEVVAIYGIQGLTQWVQFLGATEHLDIYGSMALITLFTMLFVTLISYLKISQSNQLN